LPCKRGGGGVLDEKKYDLYIVQRGGGKPGGKGEIQKRTLKGSTHDTGGKRNGVFGRDGGREIQSKGG